MNRTAPEVHESRAIDCDGGGWQQTRDAIRDSRLPWLQLAFGLHQFYLTTFLHVVISLVMAGSSHFGILPWWVTITCVGTLALTDGLLYAILKREYNLRFSDPTLMVPRTLVVIAIMLFAQIYAGPTKGACALALITTFVLASSHASLRTMLRLNGLTILAYGATIPLIRQVEGAHFNLSAELINGLCFANSLTAAVFAGATISVLRKQLADANARLGASLNQVTALATTDELTRIPNRRYITELMQLEVQRLSRNGERFSICLMDIDHFKAINDNYGHPCGDAVLRAFAERVDSSRRSGDILARWGGEEFILFLPQSPLSTTRALAERIRTLVRTLSIPELPAERSLSVSIGIAEIGPQEGLASLIERADQALYRAKQGGRDRVEAAPPVLVESRTPEVLQQVAF